MTMQMESAPPASRGTAFLSLPTELLENIILLSTLPRQSGPRSITALAQTCHLLRSLIYNTVDSHLWREIFLAAFDDSREFTTKLGFQPDHNPHDWEAAYKDRMGTAPSVHALVSATLDAPPIPPYEHIATGGHVPLPRPQRTTTSQNSVWIDSVLSRDNTSFIAQYRASPRLQWLYGPRYLEENARRRAKVLVYDMRYLTPNRCWGPFMPLEEEEEIVPNPAAALEIYGIRLQQSDLDGLDDPDYVASDTESNTDVQSDDNEDGTIIVPSIHPLLLLQHLQPGPPGPSGAVYPNYPHNIVPDYTWLAAARLLIEENMRERAFVVFPEADDERRFLAELEALRGLEVLRMGGAPGYWDVATKWDTINGEDINGKEKAEGWDWAGVEGEYRRIVCWMDYRHLLLHNLQGAGAASPTAAQSRETIRVFPMKLRVSGYLPPPDAPPDLDQLSPQEQMVYMLPVIEVEGNSTGSDMDEAAERRVWGTVRMIGGGIVRWTLTSAEPDSNDPEWITESVQMGHPGSAMGFMGLWTGAAHQNTDPVGPCWAWKVN